MERDFTLTTQQRGRLKYLLITLVIPLVAEYLFSYLINSGVFGSISGRTAYFILVSVVCSLLLVFGYFLIFRKIHTVAVNGTTITDHITVLNKTNTVHISEIKSVKRNFLGEIVLKNADGKTLLTVENGMTNFAEFEEYLKDNNFKEI